MPPFCAKTIVKESRNFELVRLKKKKKKKEKKKKERKHFGRMATFWLGTFAMLVSATGCVYFCISIIILRIRVRAIPTYIFFLK